MNVINDEVFMIEYGKHTIPEMQNMAYVDFCMYTDTIYNKKMKELREQEEAMKGQKTKV